MQIDGIKHLVLKDECFTWRARDYLYNNVSCVEFSATVTQHSVNFVPTGKSFDAYLYVHTYNGEARISPEKSWNGKMKESGMHALQHAYSVIAQITFGIRIAFYEHQLEQNGFFEYGRFKFHKGGSVYRDRKLLGSISKGDVTLELAPFELIIKRELHSFNERIKGFFFGSDYVVSLTRNKDCLLYMIKKVYGMSWPNTFIPEKPVNRQQLFYTTVIRFGALLAKADGKATSEELIQLKKFFDLDSDKLPDAGRLFNVTIETSPSVEEVLSSFAREFEDAEELKEVFLVGMLTVALADEFFDRREYLLIRRASAKLKISKLAFSRILATMGFSTADFEASEGQNNRRTSAGSSSRSSASWRARHLEVLGLDEHADQELIVTTYRTLVRRYHPDLLRGQGLPEDEIERAQTILVKINLAYEALKS
ncbi:TerB family tellurite resistance protein [Hirschia baltica]|uniref:Heat shock protein DnaJ domain protein n=1 Tax=Hirschia baltica (strain ATCC 49814 / DSM 5838 / IFAM 1418) TaxID=582402 RepID=C6XR28_HIRBI|nr:TerB family tellurite resistance protein [Hirschia baltica]ACT60559.1 heat shock protein DnaJ domain protein [Hirschia baltica ATCC 49814]